MEKKKPFAQRMEAFFAGKGFYIVLALCLTVIGVSAWSMLSVSKPDVGEDGALTVSNMDSGKVEAVLPTQAPVTVLPTPAATTAPSPAPETVPPAATAAPAVTVPEDIVPVQAQPYYVWPLSGETELPYSVAALVYDPTMRDWRTHDGVDIAAELGSTVRAVSDGKVTEIREDPRYGTVVEITHPDGLVSVYANLAALPTVSEGQQVSVGQIIGAVGDTALCEAGEPCHLHFAMTRSGISVDPAEILP